MGMIATGLGLFFISGFAAAVGVFFLLRFTRSMRPSPSQLSPVNHDDIVYLFNGRNLLDATDRARSLLPPDQNGGDDLDRFLSVFGPRFTRLDQRLAMLDPETTQTIAEHPDDPKSMTLRTELHQASCGSPSPTRATAKPLTAMPLKPWKRNSTFCARSPRCRRC